MDKISALNCIKKVLKSGGNMHIIAVYPKNSMSAAFDRLKDIKNWKTALKNRDKNFHANTKEEYKKLLKNLGFKDIKIDIINRRKKYKDFNSFVDYIMKWLPFCVGLSNNHCLELAIILAKDIYNQLGIQITCGLERVVPFLYIKATI